MYKHKGEQTYIMKKKRRKHGFIFTISFLFVVLFCMSSFAGVKLAEYNNTTGNKEIAASKDDPVKAQGKQNNNKSGQSNVVKNTDLPKLSPNAKIAYLTFDDGPSANNTPKILDILKENNIKATFFVIGSMVKQNPEMLKREKAEGHTIGNHTYSHDYGYLYSSQDNFLNDLKKNEDTISSVIGDYDKKLIRFPGGSFNRLSYQMAAENSGYKYIDWNEETGDGEYQYPQVDVLVNNFKKYDVGQKRMVILMHDASTKQATVEALPIVIKILKNQGYQFRPITTDDYEVMKKLFNN